MTSAGENEGRAVKASIHPPRLPLSVFLIIRRLVVPVLIEGPGIFPMFLHVNLKFLSRTPPLGAVILIPHAVVWFSPFRSGTTACGMRITAHAAAWRGNSHSARCSTTPKGRTPNHGAAGT